MTQFQPRPYQTDAINAGVNHLLHGKGNGIIIAPTGSGKSIIIAGIADKLEGPVLVFQPSLEILMQNYHKMRSFGYLPAIFSASAGRKQIAHITFATIGSVANRMDAFKHFEHILIDEAHLASTDASETMYGRFLEVMGKPRLIGLTATPWKLGSNSFGSTNKFLTRMRGKLWNEVIHCTQIQELKKQGFLADLEYFRTKGIDPAQLVLNSNGSDYTDASIRAAFKEEDMTAKIVNITERLVKAGRKSTLVFTKFVEEAGIVASYIKGAEMVCGETPKKERDRILTHFKNGSIPVVTNVGVATTGFDHPALDTIVLARPTLSLSLYYQMTGRGLRVAPGKKSCYIVDMVGLVNRFGHVEDFVMDKDYKGLWSVKSGGKQLTNVIIAPLRSMHNRHFDMAAQ
jgi:DNA repair protein RadD